MAFRSNYASGASLNESLSTRSFMEGHGVAAVVEDGALALHSDSARLVGLPQPAGGLPLPSSSGCSAAKNVSCTLASSMPQWWKRSKGTPDATVVVVPSLWSNRCFAPPPAAHMRLSTAGGAAPAAMPPNISGCHAPSLSDGNCLVKDLDPDRVSIANRSRPLKSTSEIRWSASRRSRQRRF